MTLTKAQASHDYEEVYYGYQCKNCGLFFPFGQEPWVDEEPEASESDSALIDGDFD